MLVLHVLAALLFLGPVTVAVSTFAPYALQAAAGNSGALSVAMMLHRISRLYGYMSVLVPVLGLGIMFTETSFFKDGKFHASMLLSVIAWVLLLVVIVPTQKKMLTSLGMSADDLDKGTAPAGATAVDVDTTTVTKQKKKLSMMGGIFSLLWVIVAVLMVI